MNKDYQHLLTFPYGILAFAYKEHPTFPKDCCILDCISFFLMHVGKIGFYYLHLVVSSIVNGCC